jgi:hypothetical protein
MRLRVKGRLRRKLSALLGGRLQVLGKLILRFELPYWRCFQGAYIAFNLRSNLILVNFQVIACLEIHPERRTIVEVARKTQGCVSSNCAFLVDDIGDPRHRNAEIIRSLPVCGPPARNTVKKHVFRFSRRSEE